MQSRQREQFERLRGRESQPELPEMVLGVLGHQRTVLAVAERAEGGMVLQRVAGLDRPNAIE